MGTCLTLRVLYVCIGGNNEKLKTSTFRPGLVGCWLHYRVLEGTWNYEIFSILLILLFILKKYINWTVFFFVFCVPLPTFRGTFHTVAIGFVLFCLPLCIVYFLFFLIFACFVKERLHFGLNLLNGLNASIHCARKRDRKNVCVSVFFSFSPSSSGCLC